MLVHRSQGSQLHALADFLKAGRVAVLVLEGYQVIQNFFLPFSQGHGCTSMRGNFSIAL
jgi:hypothetical protein